MKASNIDPKVTHYAADGFGRDTYIQVNNGGAFR
jgi:hypothetical protein